MLILMFDSCRAGMFDLAPVLLCKKLKMDLKNSLGIRFMMGPENVLMKLV
jgi:hypothetical protein